MFSFDKLDRLIGELLKTSLSFPGLPDPRTSLRAAFSCGLRGVVKNKVYVAPLSRNMDSMKDRRTTAMNTVDRDMLRRIWEEFSHWLDAFRAASGGHNKHL